jgi:hypothetical protein
MCAKSLLYFLSFIGFFAEIKAQTFFNSAPAQNIYYTDEGADNYGSGVSFFDFDNDSWDDITLAKENDSIIFYKNFDGIFEVLPLGIYVGGEIKHAIWVDYDNDGDNDLFISIHDAPCRLYNNDGFFNLIDVSIQAGLQNTSASNYGASWGDFDKDGYLDLYLCRLPDLPGGGNPIEANALFKNNGDGTFTNIAVQAGVDDGIKNSFQAVWLDYDKDGWPDLYVINDRSLYHNSLYKNNGNGTFTDVTVQTGTQDTTANPMTNTVADFDEDGDLDIFMTNTGYADVCRLMVNNNGTNFSEMAASYGIANDEFTWGAAWFDAENDSDLDLIVACDSVGYDTRTYLYINTGQQLFVEASQSFQSSYIGSSRAVAIGDVSNDGKADIFMTNANGFYSYLWENTGINTNNFIKITLKGTVSNKMAIGSWIYVYAGNKRFTHYTLCGENYLGQSSQNHIFGLGQNMSIDSVVVNYPSGIIDTYYNLNVNGKYYLIEGETSLNQISYNGNLNLCNGDSVILNAGNFETYLWSDGSQQQYLTVTQSGNYTVTVSDSLVMIYESDTIHVYQSVNPQISINANHASCYNSNNGTIFIDILTPYNDGSIIWNNGATGDSLYNLSSNTYAYTYTDFMGCSYIDSVVITQPFDINIQTMVIDYTLSNPGSVQSIINGGTPPYTIYFNGSIAGNLIDSLLPGLYSFEVVDANLCSEIVNFEILYITKNSAALKDDLIEIYPNPITENTFYINHKLSLKNIKLYSSLGQLIPFKFLNNSITLDAPYSGVLFIELTSNEDVLYFKLVKL